jgi:hypothetical protein
VNLGLLVEGGADRGLAGRLGEAFAGPPRFVQGVGPVTVELHELGPVHQALTAVEHQVRLRRTPTAQTRSPFLRPAQIERLLARLDHAAVDVPGEDRRDVARTDGDHDLVEQRHARGDLAHEDQRASPTHAGDGDEFRVAEAIADLGGLAEVGVCRWDVALEDVLHRLAEPQVPLLDAIELAVVEQPLAPGPPTGTTDQLSFVPQVPRQPERAPGGVRRIAPTKAFVVRPRPDVGAVGVPTHQVRRHRQPLEIREL